MNLKLPRSYKLALSLTLVLAPFSWLMFTEDGKRRSDLFVLALTGAKPFNIAYDKLTPTVTEAVLREQFPQVEFECAAVVSSLGDRLCAARIASFNGLPARTARMYSHGGFLRVLELGYRVPYHGMLARSLHSGLGEPREESTGVAPVWVWSLPGGEIMLPVEPPRRDADAALIWAARLAR